jgi:hypothetical protein
MVSSHPEKQDSLWWLAAAPGVWALHFLASYATAAVWCAKHGAPAPLGGARLLIAAYTALGLLALAALARRGVRRYRSNADEGGVRDTARDTSEARHQFLGFTLLSLAALSGLAVAYQALAAVFVGSCR